MSETALSEDLKVLGSDASGSMMNRYLLKLAREAFERRRLAYEKLETPKELRAYQKRMRKFFAESVGGFPKKTPLNARIVAKKSFGDYSLEKVIFESQPRHYVTGVMYIPRGRKPFPAVLVPCGHSENGKAAEPYQRACILLAKNGLGAFCYDPIAQGERKQILNGEGKGKYGCTLEHTLAGVGCILLGTSTARYRIHDGMRAIDYLASRKDVDSKRIGCTGNSGGGTMTSYLMALDDRVACAAPSCYLTSLERIVEIIGPQDAEQNIHGQIAFGMNHADYVLMHAPRPTLICTATRDFFDIRGSWDTFRQAKRFYTRLGHPERVDLVETDATHGFSTQLRVAMVRWMRRWLLGKDDAIEEPRFPIMSDEELWCTPRGQVMLIDGARSVFDMNADLEKKLAKKCRKKAPTAEPMRELAGIRPLAELPECAAETVGSVEREGCRVDKIVLRPEEGIALPALAFVPPTPGEDACLYVHGDGKEADVGAVESLCLRGSVVLAVDVRGAGETAGGDDSEKWGEYFGLAWKDYFLAYMLDRTYVGMRAEDVLVCARFLKGFGGQARRVHLVAVGEAGVPALHAAALEPELFASVTLRKTLVSWSSVVRTPEAKMQLMNAVHGALKVYDLPDLLALLPAGKVKVEEPD